MALLVWSLKRGHAGFWHALPRDIQDLVEAEYERRKTTDTECFKFAFDGMWTWQPTGFYVHHNEEIGWLRRSEVRWQNQKEGETEWNDYSMENAQVIEMAYLGKFSEVDIMIRQPQPQGNRYFPYRIDFGAKLQYRVNNPTFCRVVRREHRQEPEDLEPQCADWQAAKVAKATLGIDQAFFSEDGNACFCTTCFQLRRDAGPGGWNQERGEPPKKYAIPGGWQRFGLAVNASTSEAREVFKKWHVCYHGTTKDGARGIILGGGQLLLPGDETFEGKQIAIYDGHISNPFKRINQFTKQEEIFDPKQIFTSPCIDYCAFGKGTSYVYTKPMKTDDGKRWLVALQLRIQPDAYGVGQQTVGATEPIDSTVSYDNSQVEWYTKRRGVHVVTGLLLKQAQP